MKNKKFLKILLGLLMIIGALVLFYHCPFRYFFGVSCPGCGMTRALLAAVFSDFKTAFSYHPLFPLVIPVVLCMGLYTVYGIRIPTRRLNVYLIFVAVLMVSVYVIRLIQHDPVIMPDFDASVFSRILSEIQSFKL